MRNTNKIIILLRKIINVEYKIPTKLKHAEREEISKRKEDLAKYLEEFDGLHKKRAELVCLIIHLRRINWHDGEQLEDKYNCFHDNGPCVDIKLLNDEIKEVRESKNNVIDFYKEKRKMTLRRIRELAHIIVPTIDTILRLLDPSYIRSERIGKDTRHSTRFDNGRITKIIRENINKLELKAGDMVEYAIIADNRNATTVAVTRIIHEKLTIRSRNDEEIKLYPRRRMLRRPILDSN